MTAFRLFAAAIMVGLTLTAAAPRAQALDGYTSELTGQFMDWCTGKAGNTETACTCTIKKVAASVTPAALTTFVADKMGGGSGFSMSTATVATVAVVTQALTACVK